FILPTRQGILFAIVLVIMLIGSINYNNSLGYLLTFLLASVAVVSILYTYRNLLHLKISVGNITPVFCGEKAKVQVVIDNSGLSERFAIQAELANSQPKRCDVEQDGWACVNLSYPATRRGVQQLPRITISSVFPLGLFRAWSHVRLTNKFVVYPEPAGDTQLPYQWNQEQQQLRGYHKGSDDFAGLNTYTPGDPLGHIHWKAYAREQGLHTKKFGGNNEQELWLDWRVLSRPDDENKLRQLAKWVLEADMTEINYGLWLPGNRIPPSLGPMHKQKCLKALALFNGGNA
ncbi:MAG: DUF58 domain-containing protein, partial [Gammaproteobacteria bacterium]